MTIAPLKIPDWQQPRDLDFSALAQLPQVYRQARRDALTLANMDRLHAAQELTRLSQAEVATSLSNARVAIAANPAARNAILKRLRDAGINPPVDI